MYAFYPVFFTLLVLANIAKIISNMWIRLQSHASKPCQQMIPNTRVRFSFCVTSSKIFESTVTVFICNNNVLPESLSLFYVSEVIFRYQLVSSVI